MTVRLSNLIPKEQIKPPGEASHFKFCLSIGVVCDYFYLPKDTKYVPVYDATQMMSSQEEFESEWIPVNARSVGELTFTVVLPESFQLEEDMTVLRIFGIVFGKMTSQVEALKNNRGSAEFLGAV